MNSDPKYCNEKRVCNADEINVKVTGLAGIVIEQPRAKRCTDLEAGIFFEDPKTDSFSTVS